MVPRTINGMDSFECVSAMQKCIRRGLERDAMLFAMEMCLSSKAFFTRALNRLFVIAHEDIGLADMQSVTFAVVNLEACRGMYDPEKAGRYALALGNAIRALCRANKSREGDWFGIVAIRSIRGGKKPEVQDWMLDMHTRRGKQMGRGLDHFLNDGMVLHPAPERPEPYELEAIELLRAPVGDGGGAESEDDGLGPLRGGAR
jgi:replication-associated recombination protein RarA